MPRFLAGSALFLASLLSLPAQGAADLRGCCAPSPANNAWTMYAAKARAALRANQRIIPELGPAAAGVSDLSFHEFFGAIGDRGLEYSPKLLALQGKRVRIAGFMVHQQLQHPGLFLFTAAPVVTHDLEYGLCDDLPPALLHVVVPTQAGSTIPLAAGPLVLTGILQVGPHPEADGRNSVARLVLDPPAAGQPLLTSAFPAAPSAPGPVPGESVQ